MPPSNKASDAFDTSVRGADHASVQPPFQPSLINWEAVSLPGMLSADAIPHSPEDVTPAVEASGPRGAELIALIQDLNRCNEVLLTRVNQLEESLEASQQALQREVERSQQRSETAKMTVAQQQSLAQQQSVAQLLSELEESDAALKRQTILAETLQAQLETYQERSRQLEKECALLQKHQTEKTQKLQEAEETCRDLRSRLQRQQRYTLQFKAALEKSLDTSAFKQLPVGVQNELGFDTPQLTETTAAPNPSAMPRSEKIRPWSANNAESQADPQLLSLVRSLNPLPQTDSDSAPSLPVTSHSVAAATSAAEPPLDREAEKQLWQDVERVIENSALSTETETQKTLETPHAASTADEVQFTEPMPWGTPIPKESLVDESVSTPDHSAQPVAPTLKPLPAEVLETVTQSASTTQDPSNEVGQVNTPLAQKSPLLITEIPALDATKNSQASPSPIVHPLRPPQRKRKSLSAVELPNFPPLPKQKS